MITHKSIGHSGRLGNQMFQYATLKAVSLKTGYEYYLPDNTAVKPDGCFNFNDNKWTEYKLDLFDCFDLKCEISNNLQHNLYQEKSFTFDSEIYAIKDNTAIDGYFQSYKYFEEYKNEILNEFSFKPNILDKCNEKLLKYHNPVSVHVRRGDYIGNPNYWHITTEYIQDALNYFIDDSYTFLVFSDDIEWCKQVFPDDVVFPQGTQFEDLCMMTLCKHNIIANSSYSWWGAYLNQNLDKKVIAPRNWFTNKSMDTSDLIPSKWIII